MWLSRNSSPRPRSLNPRPLSDPNKSASRAGCVRVVGDVSGVSGAGAGDGENWLAPGGGHGCRLKEGGGVWEMDTCDRTYVWSSLSAFFFF